MIEGVEELYQRIAEEFVLSLPSRWQRAKIDTVYYSDVSEFSGEYVTDSGKERSALVTPVVSRLFRELRQKFKEGGHRVWGQATFELDPAGTFSMKWGYESCDENGDTIWDSEKWSKRQEELQERLMRP